MNRVSWTPRRRVFNCHPKVEIAMTGQLTLRSLERLKEIEGRCFDSRNRFALYRYLEAVYRLYERLRRTSDLDGARKHLQKALSFTGGRRRTHPFRLILDGTSK